MALQMLIKKAFICESEIGDSGDSAVILFIGLNTRYLTNNSLVCLTREYTEHREQQSIL